MKRAVSISIGSSKRNKAVDTTLLGQEVSIERIGTDGDMEAAALKYKELDGIADAFGVGGADLGAMVDGKWYPFHTIKPMVRYVQKTPLVDGSGLKNTLENKAASFLESHIKEYLDQKGRRVLVIVGVDRWGLSSCFADAGYQMVFGDLIYGIGLPIPIRKISQVKTLASLIMPVIGRLPFEWFYPTGEKQEKRTPKSPQYFNEASVIAGDCHYIKRFMPDRLDGKVIVTNTTTAEDVDLFRKCGVKYLVTTTPVLEGRSFGTNMMEAALVAVAGKGRPLTWDELSGMLDQLHLEPQLQELN